MIENESKQVDSQRNCSGLWEDIIHYTYMVISLVASNIIHSFRSRVSSFEVTIRIHFWEIMPIFLIENKIRSICIYSKCLNRFLAYLIS